jgi:ADP-heptose:LPS heptosyltransferase
LPFLPDVAPAEHEREALRTAGLTIEKPYPTLEISIDPKIPAKFGLTPNRYVIVHMFSGSTKRGLSPESRTNLIAELRNQLPDFELVLSGGNDDRTDAQDAAQGSKVIAGDADLDEMQQLVAQAALTVSLDTGVGHIAGHLRRPLIIISTCMGLFWWGPDQYGEGIPLGLFSNPSHCTEGHQMLEYPQCMNDIDMNEVARAAAAIVR